MDGLETLYSGASEMGLDIPAPRLETLYKYLLMLLERNREMNLTAVTDVISAVRLHLLDSLSILGAFDLSGKSVIDVGTGGGLPGAAIAICCPGTKVTFLDSTGKKLDFVRSACESLGVSADYVNRRAEDFGRSDGRERYDVATARAVANMGALCELCLPLVKCEGIFTSYKTDAETELPAARRAAEKLGGGECRAVAYTVPGTDVSRALIIIKKASPTLIKYPRAWGQIKKKPL